MYETYELSRKEWGIYGAEGILGIAVMDYVFYRNAGLFLVLLPVGMLFPLMLRKQLKKRRLETLRGQFKDAILAVASGLNAGYSVENASGSDLFICEGMYGEKDKDAKAREHKHMTFYEAAKLARDAQVGEMWLTHYSPSLTRPDEFMDKVKKIFPRAKAARDGWTKELMFEEESGEEQK